MSNNLSLAREERLAVGTFCYEIIDKKKWLCRWTMKAEKRKIGETVDDVLE